MSTAVLINRGGGSVGEREAIEQALKVAGIEAEPRFLDGSEIAEAARTSVAEGADLVIAGGGDGTLSCVARALVGTNAAMGILPLGTLNHFARDLGIPLEVEAAAKLIHSGRPRQVDVAEVNGRVFVNNSAIGVYPLLVTEREAQQRQLGRKKGLAMAVAAARVLLRFSRSRLTLTVNDHSAKVDTPLLFVGNNRYRLQMPGAGTRDRLDGGELSVVVLRSKSRLGFCAASIRALLGRRRHSDVVELNDLRQLRVDSSREAIRISIDGETALMETPLAYRIRPKALRVVAP